MLLKEWKRLVPQHLSLPAAGPAFYAQVFHPAFNLDLEDAEEAVNRFDTHTRAVGKGVQGLRNIFGGVREARIGESIILLLPLYSHSPSRDVQSRAVTIIFSTLLNYIETTGICSNHRRCGGRQSLQFKGCRAAQCRWGLVLARKLPK